MMKLFVLINVFIAVLGAFCLASYSQTLTPDEQQMMRNQDKRDEDNRRRQSVIQGLPKTRPVDSGPQSSLKERRSQGQAYATLVQLRMVNPEVEAKYKAFLDSGTGGLFRLFPDFDCVTHFVISSDGQCAGFVDSSSAYSFRARDYVVDFTTGTYNRFSEAKFDDIRFNQNKIISRGFFANGAMVSLGDVPIENVKLSDPGLKFLVDIKPAANYREGRDLDQRLDKRIEADGYTYTTSIDPHENTTYVLRNIAYRFGNVLQSLGPYLPQFSRTEAKFLDLASDKRADVIIVFRIVRRDEDGSITILWKELDRNKTPKIKFAQGESLADFRASANDHK